MNRVSGEERPAVAKRLDSLYRQYEYAQDEELRFYGKEDFDNDLVAWYDDHIGRRPHRWDDAYQAAFAMDMLEAFAKGYGKELAGKLIDIGCGSGCSLSVIEADGRWAGKLSLSGIDFAARGIEVGRERTQEVELIVGDFLKHGFLQRFDLVLSLGVFEHFPDPYAAFRKTFDILDDDGLTYIEVPNFDSKMEKETEGFGRPWRGKQLMWRLDKASYLEVIDACGFVVLRDLQYSHPHGHFTWILAKSGSPWARNAPKSLRCMRAMDVKYYIRPRVARVLPDFVKVSLRRIRSNLRSYRGE